MVASGVGGRICNVSSQAGKKAFPFLGAYCAAKAASILLTQTMATELGPQGIAVNAVCPGTVDTDLLNKDRAFEGLMGGPEGLAAFIAREIPLGRLQAAEEIADAIRWLLRRARGVTGEALNVSARTDNGVRHADPRCPPRPRPPGRGRHRLERVVLLQRVRPRATRGCSPGSASAQRGDDGRRHVAVAARRRARRVPLRQGAAEMVDTVLDVGAVRYEMLAALQSWRLTMDDAVQARPTGKSRAAADAAMSSTSTRIYVPLETSAVNSADG